MFLSRFRSASSPSLGSTTAIPQYCNGAVVENDINASGPEIAPKPLITRIREYVGQLRLIRSSIRSTAVELESLHSEFEDVPQPSAPAANGSAASPSSCMRSAADLEMAVLVQELMAMREEKADLKKQAYLLEREKKAMELIINSQQAHETALKSHINHMQMELENQESLVSINFKVRQCAISHFNNYEGVSCGRFQLERGEGGKEGGHPESRLLYPAAAGDEDSMMKHRITELLQSLEKVKRNGELRQQQQDEVINGLKKANV